LVSSKGALFAQYLWPTNASRLLTSSFCEFRPRHYHAAIDIKTWNRSGYRIFAVENGYIMRVRVSAFGYGKVIYVKLKDGNIAVYAHLSRFSSALEEYVNKIRQDRESYRVDLQLNPQQFPVKRGQLIGLTGKTGIGFPHLHFEIRNRKNEPINPLQFYEGIIPDSIKPQLYEVAFIPMDYQSLINFEADTMIYDLNKKNRFRLADTLLFSGKVGIALKIYDRAQGAANRFSFYKAKMWIDDSLVYSVQYDRFSYQESKLVELDKNFSLWRKGKGIFHNFFMHLENTLSHYDGTEAEAGFIDSNVLEDGVHHLKIEITDFSGNAAQFEFNFRTGNLITLNYDLNRWLDSDLYLRLLSPRPMKNIFVQTLDDSFEWVNTPIIQRFAEVENRGTFHYTIAVSPPLEDKTKPLRIYGIDKNDYPTLPLFIVNPDSAQTRGGNRHINLVRYRTYNNWHEFIIESGNPKLKNLLYELPRQNVEVFWQQLDERIFRIHLPVDQQDMKLDLWTKLAGINFENYTLIKKELSQTIISPDSLFRANYPPGALYQNSLVNLKTFNHSETFSHESTPYPLVGKLYVLQPFDQPVDGGIWINLKTPEFARGMPGLGLYYWDRKKGWLFIPSKQNETRTDFTARITSMEKFTLIQDTVPPTIMPFQKIQNGTLRSNKGKIDLLVKDEMSGIQKESQIQIYLDKKWHLFDYDPEEDRINLKIPENARNLSQLHIKIEDNVGNIAEREFLIR
jgi:hypothetical protein